MKLCEMGKVEKQGAEDVSLWMCTAGFLFLPGEWQEFIPDMGTKKSPRLHAVALAHCGFQRRGFFKGVNKECLIFILTGTASIMLTFILTK